MTWLRSAKLDTDESGTDGLGIRRPIRLEGRDYQPGKAGRTYLLSLDVVGHYSRPDIFNLQVDTRAQSPVEFEN